MKDDFVSNMTHELKTPIAIAYSANDALLNYDTSNDPSKKETYLLIANKQPGRLGELVENILANEHGATQNHEAGKRGRATASSLGGNCSGPANEGATRR